ncbi:hypothetical protein N0V88_002902 [Collariella sp. IMI 366227]|nr:hypothetical protein N0V88_002902 [Collariella sp. IMI 366227]
MSKAKLRSHLLQLVDSDSEGGIGKHSLDIARSVAKSAKQKTAMPPKKTKTGRPAANKVTKPATKPVPSKRAISARVAAAAEEVTVGGKGAAAKKSSAATGTGRGRKRAAPPEEDEDEEEDTAMTEAPAVETPPATKQKSARGRPKKVVVEAEPEPTGARGGRKAAKRTDPDTTAEEVSEIPETQQPGPIPSDSEDEDEDDLADLPAAQSTIRKLGRGSIPVPSSVSKRPPSSPDKDGPALRRRLGELTQKYETLELKYRDLKEIAVKDAERNFDKLKKQGPGSTAASRLAATASEAAFAAAQKKEDLYGDLTGLIVRSVKREGGEEVFDCLQTGRNGTLHFKLAIDVDPDDNTGGDAGGGEVHCHYTPQLDASRDRALIAVLPGYLVDEISFPQTQAGKFYARVLKALNETAEG